MSLQEGNLNLDYFVDKKALLYFTWVRVGPANREASRFFIQIRISIGNVIFIEAYIMSF